MTTSAVTYTVPSPAWTGTIDATLANLLSDVTVKDFTLLYNSVEQGTTEKALWAKTSSTQLTYSGAALTTNDIVTVRRKTPNVVVQTVSPQSIILSSLWNSEFDRQIRWREEADAFYNVNVPVTGHIVDTAYTVGWDSVTGDSPSKNVVYDLFNSTVASMTPKWTFTSGGTLTAATGSTVTLGTGSTLSVNSGTTISGTIDASSSTAVKVPTVAKTTPASEASTKAVNQAWAANHYHSLVPGGRLCIESGKPTPTLGSITSGTLYYTPFTSDVLWLYDLSATEWRRYEFTEVNITVNGITNSVPYDVFIYDNSGTLTLELVTWTTYNSRATQLSVQDGRLVKTGSLNKLYLGSICTMSANTLKMDTGFFSTDDKESDIGITNHYNRIHSTVSNYSNALENVAITEVALNSGSFLQVLTGYSGLPFCTFSACGYGSGTTTLYSYIRSNYPSAGVAGTFLSRTANGVTTLLFGSTTCSSTTISGTGMYGVVGTSVSSSATTINDLVSVLTVNFEF